MYNNYKESALNASSMAHAMSEVNDIMTPSATIEQ